MFLIRTLLAFFLSINYPHASTKFQVSWPLRDNHILENELLYKYQSGFLPGRSTVHHLIELPHNTCLSFENYEANCQVFCDISKAFDRVWHKGLLYILERYDIKGYILMWIKSYLHSRKQRVFVNGVLSNNLPINAGVPQGSVLGLLLFLSYINDITDKLVGKHTSICRWYFP